MVRNLYFDNQQNSEEQNLIDDLVAESIKIYGIDTWYMPRTLGQKDDLLNEDDLPIFNNAYLVEMYVKSVDGFEGEGDFLSKFGLQIRDSIVLTVSQRVFHQEIAANDTQVSTRPKEGDLIYVSLNNKIFEVMHVEHESVFFQMGSLQTYDLRCELLEFSNERFNTGIDFIDSKWNDIRIKSDTTINDIELIDSASDNLTIETEADSLLDFTKENPFGEKDW